MIRFAINSCRRIELAQRGPPGRFARRGWNIPMLGVFACILFWLLFFAASGLFSSGFHLIDDHVLVDICADLAAPDANFAAVMRKWIAMDFGERRFRPLYYISRVLRAEFFGLSWPAWALYNALLAAATSAALFAFGRLIRFTRVSSLLLVALSMLGRPSTIWWRLGTPETEGNFFLALSLLFVAAAEVRSERRVVREIGAVLLAVLASLTKEGMILYLPAIAAIRVWLPCWLSGASLKSSLMASWPFLAALGLVAGVEVLGLWLTVGTAGTGYAGVDAGTFDPGRLRASMRSVDSMSVLWLPATATAVALLARVFPSGARSRPRVMPLLLGWLAFLIAALPQVVLYSKSGWVDHYFNPIVISAALLMLLPVDYLRRAHRWLYLAFVVLVLAQINPRFKWTKQHAREYAAEGVVLQQLLGAIEACSRDDEPLLLVANPRAHYEEAFSLRTYLMLTRNRRNVYLATVGGTGSEILSDALSDKEKARAFLNPKTLEDHYFRGEILPRLSPTRRQQLGAILILSPESLQNAFLAGTSAWLRPDRYRTTDYEVSGVRVRLMCQNR